MLSLWSNHIGDAGAAWIGAAMVYVSIASTHNFSFFGLYIFYIKVAVFFLLVLLLVLVVVLGGDIIKVCLFSDWQPKHGVANIVPRRQPDR
jgi:hypothetical protein